MKLNEITKKMNELATLNAGKIDAKIKFEFSDGYVFIDDTTSPPTISNENNDADCVIEINNENFAVSLIPYTWENTIFKYSEESKLVNIETDLTAKYIENFYNHSK